MSRSPRLSRAKDFDQQKAQLFDEAAEVVACGSKDCIGGLTLAVPRVIAAHSVLGLEMADHRLDGGTPAQLALDLWRYPPLLT